MSIVEAKAISASEPKKTDLYFKSFIAGGLACMCSKSAVAPLDRIKILFQAHNHHYKHLGIFSCLKSIVEKEKLSGLYKGNGAQMVRIFPYGAVQFVSFEFYKKTLKNTFGPSHASKFFAGSGAGVTAVIMTYPLDVVRARLAFQVSGEHVYSGIYDTLTCMVRREGGVAALYKGLSPTILAKIPSAGLSFYVFERSKSLCLEYMPSLCGRSHSGSSGGVVLTLTAKLCCGGLAGAIAQTLCYPLDVARRKMQLGMMTPETEKFGKGLIETLILTYKKDGISNGLFRGMTINYLRVVPMMAVSLSTYELTKQLFGLDTGIDS